MTAILNRILMPLDRSHFTCRRLMVAVAIIGVITGALILIDTRHRQFLAEYQKQALAEHEYSLRVMILVGKYHGKSFEMPSESKIGSIWNLNPHEQRLLEADQKDVRVMMSDAGWNNSRKLP